MLMIMVVHPFKFLSPGKQLTGFMEDEEKTVVLMTGW